MLIASFIVLIFFFTRLSFLKPLYFISQIQDISKQEAALRDRQQAELALQQLNSDLEARVIQRTQHEYMDFVIDGTKRMQGSIENLLTYSRVNTNEQVFSTVDCHSVVQQAIANLAKFTLLDGRLL